MLNCAALQIFSIGGVLIMSFGNFSQFSFMKGKKILLTGGTGFVGRHLIPVLIKAGADVTCLVRHSSDTSVLPDGITVLYADFETGSGLDDAVAGKDIVIHMAALLFGISRKDYLNTNTAIARSFAGSVRRLRSSGKLNDDFRFVLVSSIAAAGPCALGSGLSETEKPAPVSAYGWSKLLVEEILGRELGSALVVLRPPIIYGSGDRGLLPMFKGAKIGVAFCPGWNRIFPVSIIHADDMASAVLCVCRPDAAGTYHVSDGCVYTMDQFYRAMGFAVNKICGRSEWRRIHVFHIPLPLIALSSAVTSFTGIALDFILRRIRGRGLRQAPQWNMDKYLEAKQDGWISDGSRIVKELGFIPAVDLESGMKEAAEGYRRDGWL